MKGEGLARSEAKECVMADSPVWVFSGRIHPERADVNVRGLPSLQFGFDADHAAKAEISIGASQLSVRVTGDLGIDLLTLKNVVQVLSSTVVDALGWGNGCGYTVEVTSCQSPEGHTVFGVNYPELQKDLPAAPADAANLLSLILNDASGELRPLRRALVDFRQAILAPDDTPFYCFRAVEGLMYSFGRNPRKGRQEFCRRLRVETKWITENLERHAREIRHGKVVPVSADLRTRTLLATRTVVERYILLKHLGVEELPLEKFPTLAASDN